MLCINWKLQHRFTYKSLHLMKAENSHAFKLPSVRNYYITPRQTTGQSQLYQLQACQRRHRKKWCLRFVDNVTRNKSTLSAASRHLPIRTLCTSFFLFNDFYLYITSPINGSNMLKGKCLLALYLYTDPAITTRPQPSLITS